MVDHERRARPRCGQRPAHGSGERARARRARRPRCDGRRSGAATWRSASRSRTPATGSGSSGREPTAVEAVARGRAAHRRRWSARRCAGSRGAARCGVRSPKMPSTRPASNPSAPRRRWSSATSSPRSMRRGVVEQPVAERGSRPRPAPPRSALADAVDTQAPAPAGRRGRRPRCRRRRRPGSVGGRSRSPRAAAGAGGRGRPRRLARGVSGTGLQEFARAPASSWPLPLAPMSRFLASPSLKTSSVGMLMTSKRRARSGLSSTLTLATRSLSACSPAISSRIGRDHLARSAPLGPEVDEHRLVGAVDLSSKVLSVRVQ